MDAFLKHHGLVAPMARANIDTDAIIPKQFLKRIERTGFGQYLFYDWRFDENGNPNPDFILNQEPHCYATVLVAGPNFGCGSSREHAPWALLDFGFRVVIAPSFADIFYNNCFKNGVLPIVLPEDAVAHILTQASKTPLELNIDLSEQQVSLPSGETYTFAIDPYRKHLMMEGLDDIGLSLKHETAIANYEKSAPFAVSITL